MRKHSDEFEYASLKVKNKEPKKSITELQFDNFISPYWYGSLIDNSNKLENLKSIYEAYRSGFITIEDFHQTLFEINDNRPMARSL